MAVSYVGQSDVSEQSSRRCAINDVWRVSTRINRYEIKGTRIRRRPRNAHNHTRYTRPQETKEKDSGCGDAHKFV